MAGPIPPQNGGTGVNNGTNTLTLTGGNVEFKVPASGTYTLPTAGTMPTIKASGTVSLVGGTATVSVANIATDDFVLFYSTSSGGTPGLVRLSAIVSNTSFTLTSLNILDTSTYSYLVLDKT